MNHVSIADGCSIQGSVICSNVQIQERAVLKDCQVTLSNANLCSSLRVLICLALYNESVLIQVGAGFVVSAGGEYKGEALAKKEKF